MDRPLAAVAAPGSAWREAFVGVDVEVPIAGGGRRRHVNLDNAASTPPLRAVEQAVVAMGRVYSSVHRGAGWKSQVCTAAYEEARHTVAHHLDVDLDTHVVIFVKHTTEAINLMARKLAADGPCTVVASLMEHHANLLPWRHLGPELVVVGLDTAGDVDREAIVAAVRAAPRGRVVVAITGASNVTGRVQDVRAVADLAHAHGALVLVDAAQLAPHRAVSMHALGADILAVSAHKLYAPYGSGALVAPIELLRGMPALVGGGAVSLVSTTETVWSEPPDSAEAGSPNVIGAVALAVAMRTLDGFGTEALDLHERGLADRLLEGLARIPGARPLGGRHPGDGNLGVVSFQVDGLHHALLGAALSWEWGIGVRHGCFCAHPYLLSLLDVPEADIGRHRAAILAGDRRLIPGAVRASMAPYNDEADVDALLEAVESIARHGVRERYRQDVESGDFLPVDPMPALPSIDELIRAGRTQAG